MFNPENLLWLVPGFPLLGALLAIVVPPWRMRAAVGTLRAVEAFCTAICGARFRFAVLTRRRAVCRFCRICRRH